MLILSYSFLHFLHLVYIWLETTFGTVQKWSLRPLLDSPKGGLNIGILFHSLPHSQSGSWANQLLLLYTTWPLTCRKTWTICMELILIFFFFWFGFYGPFKNISLISSLSLIRGGRKPEYPAKNHLTYRCRTWHLTCDPIEARTHSGERSNV